MQFWNIYRSRAIGFWLQKNGINVIPNLRYSDHRSYKATCFGIPKNGTIAIGSHGCIKGKEDRQYFIEGLRKIVDLVSPKIIIVYGTAPDYIFDTYKERGIEILQFRSDFSITRMEGVYGGR